MYGAPSGDATTVIFVGISVLGLLSIAISLILFFLKNGHYRGKWYWLVLLIILGIFEMSMLNWEVFF
jgi:hypothetical protein